MDKMDISIFDRGHGAEIFDRILCTVKKYGMESQLSEGVLLGLSGGADSVMLLYALLRLKDVRLQGMKILAVHVNHMIRGSEADRDESFCKELCRGLDVEFVSVSIDVPKLSEISGKGLEEAARDARYSAFNDIIRGRNDVSSIVTAHNATDNAETVLFNIVRGSGARGASGIAPVRDNVLRPLIEIPKREILSLLDSCGIKYMTDSTNDSTEYSRNYIRHEILPRLARLNPRFEEAFLGLSDSLRHDADLITRFTEGELSLADASEISREWFVSLHPAVLPRALCRFSEFNGVSRLERKHIDAISELLARDNFRYSVPGEVDFACERGVCRFIPKASCGRELFMPLSAGVNNLLGYRGIITIGDTSEDNSSNVYKISIQANLSSAIIVGGLHVRLRRDGDAYYYGGMTHKLKKVFNDRGIPPSHRSRIPIIADDNGIVWVPGLGVRDDSPSFDEKNNIHISFTVPYDGDGEELYSALKET